MSWRRRDVLAAAGAALMGSGCVGRDKPDDDLESFHAQPVENKTATATPPDDHYPDTATATDPDTATPATEDPDTHEPVDPDASATATPHWDGRDDLYHDAEQARNSLERNMGIYNRAFATPALPLQQHSSTITIDNAAQDEYLLDVSVKTSKTGEYSDISSCLDGSRHKQEELDHDLGHALAYMIASTAPYMDDYFACNQPDDAPVVTDIDYRIMDHDGDAVYVDPSIDDLVDAVAIRDKKENTQKARGRIYDEIVCDTISYSA